MLLSFNGALTISQKILFLLEQSFMWSASSARYALPSHKAASASVPLLLKVSGMPIQQRDITQPKVLFYHSVQSWQCEHFVQHFLQ